MENRKTLLKILVCDDDPADRKLIRTCLKQMDDTEIVLLEAGDRDEIRSALDRGSIDLVFMDLQMPEKSGMEWLAEITHSHVAPVVMLTGLGSEDIAAESIQEGAVGYLSKAGLSRERLETSIDNALRRWRQVQQSRASQEELERLARFDSLTGLYNRRTVLGLLGDQMKHARRYDETLAVLMVDIDHFKKVNDRHGHLVGDRVLEAVASVLSQSVREVDAVGRYGGEEFLATLPKADTSAARIVGERMRRAVEAAGMTAHDGTVFHVTVSVGISGYRAGEDHLEFIGRADDALYSAKRNGRNRVEASD